MQIITIKILVFLFAINLLTACSNTKDLFNPIILPKIHNEFTPSIIWHRLIGNGNYKYNSTLSIAYNNSIIYGANDRGIIQAITFNSNKILWSINLLKYINFNKNNKTILFSSGLTVSNNKIYIGTNTGKIFALNKINGKIIWKTNIFEEITSKPVISNKLVLIHTNNGILHALDELNGHQKWSVNLDTSVFSIRGKSTPTIINNIAIIGSNKGCINAVMLDTGVIIWKQYISFINGTTEISRLHDVNATPVIDRNTNTIFAIAYNGNLVAIDLKSSKIIWNRNIGSVHNIILLKNIIYLIDQNDNIFAINKKNGIIIWVQSGLLYHHLTAPIIYNNYLVTADINGYIHWLNIYNGNFISRNKINNYGFLNQPIIAKNKLIIQSQDGTIYLIKH